MFKITDSHPSLAPSAKTEVDILVDLYTTYMRRLHSQGNLTDSNVDRMVKQLDAKIKNLNQRSQQLENRRRRRRGGLARFFRRMGRGIGRFIRRLGRGVGKAAEYLIEEVAPEVIRDMVLTGQPLNAKVFWKGVRKVVRSRLKSAVGSHLARRGVPPEVLAEAGLDIAGELDDDEEPGETVDPMIGPQIGYGNHTVDIVDSEGNWGYFTWKGYWTNLSDTFEDRCQRTMQSTVNVDGYLEDYSLTLLFEMDAGKLSGETSGEGSEDFTYEVTTWAYDLKIEQGWVRPSSDGTGWSFGGDVVFDVNINDQWECLECIPDGKGFCQDVKPYWLEDEKTTSVRAKLEGWTEQVVPGEGDEPDRLEPGGAYTFVIYYEDDKAELLLDCEDCVLPGDFPPPVYLEQ